MKHLGHLLLNWFSLYNTSVLKPPETCYFYNLPKFVYFFPVSYGYSFLQSGTNLFNICSSQVIKLIHINGASICLNIHSIITQLKASLPIFIFSMLPSPWASVCYIILDWTVMNMAANTLLSCISTVWDLQSFLAYHYAYLSMIYFLNWCYFSLVHFFH